MIKSNLSTQETYKHNLGKMLYQELEKEMEILNKNIAATLMFKKYEYLRETNIVYREMVKEEMKYREEKIIKESLESLIINTQEHINKNENFLR